LVQWLRGSGLVNLVLGLGLAVRGSQLRFRLGSGADLELDSDRRGCARFRVRCSGRGQLMFRPS